MDFEQLKDFIRQENATTLAYMKTLKDFQTTGVEELCKGITKKANESNAIILEIKDLFSEYIKSNEKTLKSLEESNKLFLELNK